MINSNDLNGNGTGDNAGYRIYGPNETISFTAGQYSGTNKGLSLYAVWVKTAGNLQEWNGCGAMEIGEVTALTDLRDNDTYAVAKLADGKCWMIENLRLDNTNSDNATGALAQGYGTSATYGNFSGLAEPETTNFSNSTTANSLYYSGTQSGTASVNIGITDNPGYRFPRYNNQNTISPATQMNDVVSNVYSYGNYYTWAAAIADTAYYSSGDHNTTSICPKGWHLPTGNTGGEFSTLDSAMGGTGDYQSTAVASNRWRTFPGNSIYSGYASGSSLNSRGSYGNYWSSTAYDDSGYAYGLGFRSSNVLPGTTYYGNKYGGRSIRCMQ